MWPDRRLSLKPRYLLYTCHVKLILFVALYEKSQWRPALNIGSVAIYIYGTQDRIILGTPFLPRLTKCSITASSKNVWLNYGYNELLCVLITPCVCYDILFIYLCESSLTYFLLLKIYENPAVKKVLSLTCTLNFGPYTEAKTQLPGISPILHVVLLTPLGRPR